MSWNNDRNPGNWQGNTGYSNNPGNWNPNNPGNTQGNWAWNNNPNFTSGDWGQGYNQGNWGQGYNQGSWGQNYPQGNWGQGNQGNWGGTWSSNRQPWTNQQGWSGNQNWGPWTAPGFSGYWVPWSNNSNPNQGYNQGNWGQGNYGRGNTPWNYGFNNQGSGYGTAYGYGPQTGYGPNFNGGYGQGWGNNPFDENEGEYSGVGPQNYRRSDQRIEEDVCDELTADSYVDAHDVNVTVNSGVVTLSGTVPTRDMRRRAEEDADSVNGVNDVRNDLRIGQHTHDDTGMMTNTNNTTTPTTARTRTTTR